MILTKRDMNLETMEVKYAVFNSFEFAIPTYIIDDFPTSGPADNAVAEAREDKYVKAELAKLDPKKVKYVLKGYGAWDEKQLSNHNDNLDRLVWLGILGIIEDDNDENEDDD